MPRQWCLTHFLQKVLTNFHMKIHLLRQVGAIMIWPLEPVRHGALWVYALQIREKKRLQMEMAQIRGLMSLLMKQRNGSSWTMEERVQLKAHLHQILALSPYMLFFIAPGGFLALPVLAWWLDRRRQKRAAEPQPPIA